MKLAITTVMIGTLGLLAPWVVWAQWPDYPDRNVARLPSGEPDLNAPAPRTADGKVDFTGVWGLRGGGGGGRGQRGQANAAANTAPAGPPVAAFFNLGQNMPGGLPMQPWAEELVAKRMADKMKDNPDAHCLPIGLTQLHLHPQPRKIVQTPDLIVIMYESNGGLRQIFLDGRPSPDNDPLPWWYGYSTGTWEGDTLVVTTTHIRDMGWLDVNGHPLTSEGKIIERFRRPNFGNIEIDVTIDDPKAYTKPFTVRVNHRIMVDTELIEFICNENEKSSQYFDK